MMKKCFGFDQLKFYNSATVLCVFKSIMIWADVALLEETPGWYGVETKKPSPSLQEHIWLHRGERWSSLQNIFRPVQGIIHSSLDEQTLAIQFATEITLIITDLN